MNNRMAICLAMAGLLVASAAHAGDADEGEAKSKPCAGCHGTDGNSTLATNPILAGQHEAYLIDAMKAYKDGRRDHAAMKAFVMPLSDEDMADIAAYFSTAK